MVSSRRDHDGIAADWLVVGGGSAGCVLAVGDTGHICGTCRMGAPDDPRSVVDPRGRVLGVEGLWVADASVFPEVPRANTNLPTIAAAERLSDLIRDAAGRPARVGTASVPVRAGS